VALPLSEAITAGQTGHVAAHNDIHDVVNEAARYNVANTFAASQTISNNGGKTTLALTNTTVDVGLTIGADTNLYRSAANVLKTDDEFVIGINGGKDTLALTDTAANVGITIGGDTTLYRSAANMLQTDDDLTLSRGASTASVWLTTTSHSRQLYLTEGAGELGIWNATDSLNIIKWRATGILMTSVKSEIGLAVRARDDPTNASKEWEFFSSTDKHFAFWNQSVSAEAFELNTTIADTETAMLVRRNVGGTLSLQRVSMGAADSGGAGFKVLRVPN
jgi:hypothetical protein